MKRPLIPVVALQAVGMGCVLLAAGMIWDGWYALGVFGVSLLAAAELVHRES